MSKLLLLVLTMILYSCALSGEGGLMSSFGGVDPKNPVEAGKYEAIFRFTCGDDVLLALTGTASCQYAERSDLKLFVATPNTEGQIIVRSSRRQAVLDFKGPGWAEIPWKLDDRGDSGPLIIIVASSESGIQMGKFYPYVSDKKRPAMDGVVDVYCYASGVAAPSKGQHACQQPAGTQVSMSLRGKLGLAGRYLFTADGCELKGKLPASGTFSKDEGASFPVVAVRSLPGACFVRLNVAWEDGSIAETEIYLDFWDLKYVPLSSPIPKLDDDEVSVCAPIGWRFLNLNDTGYKRKPWSAGCWEHNLPKGQVSYAIAWDSYGRCSILILQLSDIPAETPAPSAVAKLQRSVATKGHVSPTGRF